jgi:hypothetical protein
MIAEIVFALGAIVALLGAVVFLSSRIERRRQERHADEFFLSSEGEWGRSRVAVKFANLLNRGYKSYFVDDEPSSW